MIIASVWMTIETPIAVISGARRGALRSGHPLDEQRQHNANRHSDRDSDQQDHRPRQARLRQQRHDGDAYHRTHHQHIAVGEVDQLQDAVDHGVAQGHQSVDAA
jgi:hypothetical protein